MTGMIVAPVGQLLAVWLITIAVVAAGAAVLAYLSGDTHGERRALADCERRHRPPAPPAPPSLDRWRAQNQRGATEPIPMWALEAAIAVVEHEQYGDTDTLTGLDRSMEATELEIRRLGDQAIRRIGAPR